MCNAALTPLPPRSALRTAITDHMRTPEPLEAAPRPDPVIALMQESGKTIPSAISEIREAVDFLRYYATQIPGLDTRPLGSVACISPWNFPVSIFVGRVATALAAGNGVLAKLAEKAPLIAQIDAMRKMSTIPSSAAADVHARHVRPADADRDPGSFCADKGGLWTRPSRRAFPSSQPPPQRYERSTPLALV
jgi:hypothetical protein